MDTSDIFTALGRETFGALSISPHIGMKSTHEACDKFIPFLEAQLLFVSNLPLLATKAPVFQSLPRDSTTGLIGMYVGLCYSKHTLKDFLHTCGEVN